jgi:predicted nuclease of restriction endonuclease-like RecB superfamily
MYELYEENGQILTDITGTASILKMTRKYGTSMAKLIPSIVRAERWWIRAEILEEHSNRIYRMEIDDSYKRLFPEYDEKVEYDSSIEVEFERKIRAIKPDVEVLREPDVVKAGRYAFIPDFLIRKGNREVYVEIVGFWTSEYLKKKVEKIREAKVPLVVVAREDYTCDRGEAEDVILFSKRIPYNEVVRRINEYLRGDVKEITFEGEVVDLGRLARDYGVSVDRIAGLIPDNYILAGSYAVRKDVFERMAKEVEEAKPEKLSDIIPVLKRYGVGYDVLKAMGYEIV